MKKTLLALTVLSASSMVFAATQVTLYGKIDESALVQKAGKGDTSVQMKSGYTGASRWGIKGTEDLGNGYTVGFTLENGINADDGSVADSDASAFGREALLYVNGGFGRVTFGKMGTLGFAQSTAILVGPVFGVTYGTLGWNATNYLATRINNAVVYQTPSLGGLTIHAMYGNGGVGPYEANGDDSKEWSKNDHYYGIGVKYASKELSGSLIFETVDHKDVATGAAGRKPQYQITVGGWWQVGAIRPTAVYGYRWGENYFKQHAAQVGLLADMGGGTARIGFKYLHRKADGQGLRTDFLTGKDSGSYWNVGVGYEYPLSKRTKVYAAGGYTGGNKGLKDGGAKGNINYDGYQIAAGMVHDF